tara:strand:+ start:369 stop:545 length:177 start_codon:yes stop_codon:yes gene_type:complete
MKKLKKEKKLCVICGDAIHDYGHNAEPTAKGRCCDECNYNIVLNDRIKLMFNRQINGL